MAIEASEIGEGLGSAVAQEPAAPVSVQPGLRRRVVGLAGPVIGENLLETMLGIVDTVLVARLGATATAGIVARRSLWYWRTCRRVSGRGEMRYDRSVKDASFLASARRAPSEVCGNCRFAT